MPLSEQSTIKRRALFLSLRPINYENCTCLGPCRYCLIKVGKEYTFKLLGWGEVGRGREAGQNIPGLFLWPLSQNCRLTLIWFVMIVHLKLIHNCFGVKAPPALSTRKLEKQWGGEEENLPSKSSPLEAWGLLSPVLPNTKPRLLLHSSLIVLHPVGLHHMTFF